MNFEQYKNTLPDYAKDIKLNLSNLHSQYEQQGLNATQFFGSALAVAYALNNPEQIRLYEAFVNDIDSSNLRQAVKTATTIMAMNNVYYRTIHLAGDKTLSSLPAGLRMNGLRGHGIDQNDFELFALAVSAINGCGMCIQSHIKQLLEHGITLQAIQTTLRLAAVLSAAAQAGTIA
ncbi:carboxymuconolactone decarboxylase family protein [Legionella sp. W05-934-2]|uniref:carboxymuconolactone decarboxylase family protein n=1 Tax=Legionella sp. W05-934-2 TaxID=1198649 RepID=UPI003461DDD3